MNHRFSLSAFAFIGLFAMGCTAPAAEEEQPAASSEQNYGTATPVGVAAAPQAAAMVGSFTEIYRGNLNINNGMTYNNPAGSLIKVRVTGCQLATLGVAAVDSNLAVNFAPAPAGLGPDGQGGYVGLWRLPYGSNLGQITVVGTAYGFFQQCYAVVEQSDGGFTPPPPPPPQNCGTLNEFQCQVSLVCQPIYAQQWVLGPWGYQLLNRYTGCVSR